MDTRVEASSPESDARQAARLSDLINSSWITRAIQSAIELGVFDALDGRSATADALAEQLACPVPPLQRLLVALVTLELCQRAGAGFRLTRMGELLASDTPGSLRDWARFWCEDMEPLWSDLGQAIREGRSVRDIRGAGRGFGRLDGNAGKASLFNAAMASNSHWVAQAFAKSAELETVRHLVDVGGGRGALVAAVLHAHPAADGVVFDLPHARDGASAFLEKEGLSDRARFVAGDFFAEIPAGGDAYVLKSVLHDWNDEECKLIIARCRAAMASTGRLFVVERLLAEDGPDSLSDRAWARSDLNMMVALGTRERHGLEYRALLQTQGFEISSLRPLAMGLTAILAVPI